MKKNKMFLSKKRGKDFELEKNRHNTKDFPNNKKKIFKIIKDRKNTNSVTYSKNNLKKNHKHSLKKIAKLVLEFIKSKKVTSVNQSIEHIINILNLENSNELLLKNIKKKVLKTIDIMSYMRIKKINQNLEYIYYNSEIKERIEDKHNIENKKIKIKSNDNQIENENENLSYNLKYTESGKEYVDDYQNEYADKNTKISREIQNIEKFTKSSF